MEEFYALEEMEECVTLSFKFNLEEGDDEKDLVKAVKLYVEDYSSSLYYVAGRHDEGKNEVAHVHVNFIVKNYNASSNESRRRKTWTAESGCSLPKGMTMSQSVITEFDSAQKCLAYPLKEGKLVSSYGITTTLLLFLECYAKQEYEAKKQRDLAKQRSSEKTDNLLTKVLGLIPETLHFTDYGTFKRYIYPKIYLGLKINEYPKPRTVQDILQLIAINKKIVEPWYFDRN